MGVLKAVEDVNSFVRHERESVGLVLRVNVIVLVVGGIGTTAGDA
jgi:hypothetical protein